LAQGRQAAGFDGHSASRVGAGHQHEDRESARSSKVPPRYGVKNGGSQIGRVEHVYVNDVGQAVIGNGRKDGSGGESEKYRDQMRGFAKT
jgi:hypothetical protein